LYDPNITTPKPTASYEPDKPGQTLLQPMSIFIK
jgi:hypothetical protein